MRIIRAPRQGHFTIVPNETARDRGITYRALGLLVELLSHEDGWETSADRIAARAQEGKAAIRTMLNELEEHHYLLRKKERGTDGRYEWTWFIYDVPQPEDADPDRAKPSSPVDNSVAPSVPPVVDNVRGEVIHNATGDPQQQNRRSAPESSQRSMDDSPVAEPPMDDPVMDDSGLADQSPVSHPRPTGLHKKGSFQKTTTNTPPPKPPAPDAVGAGPDPEVEDGIREILRLLPTPLLPRSKGQMDAFCEALAPYLLTGWTPEVIAARAGFEPIPEQVHSPAGFLRQRLANLRVEAPATPKSMPWCGECDEKNRWREHPDSGQPFKCPECHPSFA